MSKLLKSSIIMAYADFTFESVEKTFQLSSQIGDLFPALAPVPVTPWLKEGLAQGMELALVSEKARGEFIIGPVLLAARDLSSKAMSIYSGQRLDIDPRLGLVGEVDFILTLTPPLPVLHAPVLVLVEAKKGDIDQGWGQCSAQMVAARMFNEREGRKLEPVFGCITSGEAWQFLQLEGATFTIDSKRYYISNPGAILAVFQSIIARGCTEVRKAG